MLHVGLLHKLWIVPKSPARGHQVNHSSASLLITARLIGTPGHHPIQLPQMVQPHSHTAA